MANQCEWYPCHSGIVTEFSCEFCFCPEYYNNKCSGNPKWTTMACGNKLKDCSECLVNHSPEYVTKYYKEKKSG